MKIFLRIYWTLIKKYYFLKQLLCFNFARWCGGIDYLFMTQNKTEWWSFDCMWCIISSINAKSHSITLVKFDSFLLVYMNCTKEFHCNTSILVCHTPWSFYPITCPFPFHSLSSFPFFLFISTFYHLPLYPFFPLFPPHMKESMAYFY